MASTVRLAIGLIPMLVYSTVYAGGTVNLAPVEPPAKEAPPAAPVNVKPEPPVTIHLAPPAEVSPSPVVKPAAPAPKQMKYYMGLGLGPTHFANAGVPGYTGCAGDNRDTGYKIFAGRQLGDHFAVEAGYVNLGGMSVSGCQGPAQAVKVVNKDNDDCWPNDKKHPEIVSKTVPGPVRGQSLDIHGITLAGVVSTPVLTRHLSVFAKAGAFFWRSRSDGDFGAQHASGTGPVYGVGAQYAFSHASLVRLEGERYDRAGETSYDTHPDINMVSISFIRRF